MIEKSAKPVGYNLLNVLLCWCFFLLPGLAQAQISSKIILYNSAYDYFGGDRLEYVTRQNVAEELKHYPPTYSLVGLGAGIQDDWSGAVIVGGTVNRPIFYQTAAKPPHVFQPLIPESFHWLQLAFCDPRRRLSRKMRGVRSMHQFITDQLHMLGNVKLAAVKINGMLSNVVYSSQPSAEPSSSANRRSYSTREWDLSGLYFKDYELQLVGSKSGWPVILFGIDSNRENGGYIQSASVVRANMTIYPLTEYKIMQSDLSIAGARLGEKLMLRLKNEGDLNVRGVALKMTIPNLNTEEEVVVSIPAHEDKIVKFNRPAKGTIGNILFKIDPQEKVRELREDNNELYFYLNQRRQ